MDIISCAILPSFNGSYTDGRRDVIFKALRDSNTALITTLDNTTMANTLTNLRFPSDQPDALATGVAQLPVLNANPSEDQLFARIGFLMPPVKVGSFRVMAPDKYPTANISSSFTTTALAGIAALAMSQAQQRMNKAALMNLFQQTFNQPFDALSMLQQTAPAYYHK